MAFQTNVFRDGQWMTETVDIAAALQASATTKEAAAPIAISDRPPCGILSSTIVESPMIHKILPVRIRSKDHNDIAFIGSHAVVIRELRENGQMHEVLKYRSLHSRIRNAVVLGDCPDESGTGSADDQGHMSQLDSLYQKTASGTEKDAAHVLPPQLLVLVLDNGQMEFLFTTATTGRLKLYSSSYAPPGNIPHHGHHLVVDPSFRYMAASPFEELLVVYELETLKDLDNNFRETGQFPKPFKSARIRSLRGTIHDVQFLYPRLQDDYHIIIMVIVSSRSSSPERTLRRRYITWDWEAGDDLRSILSEPGHIQSLSKQDGAPLFSIPLKSQNAFFIVYEDHMAIVRQSLSSGEYDSNRVLEMPAPSPLHHGAGPPLWVAWARPFRRKDYAEKTDIIYLAREDGLVFHIEIDSMTLLYSGMELGCLGTNIGPAFSTAYDKFSDLFVVGGDSSPGGIWKLPPRGELEQISTLSNWSPATDMTTTSTGASGTLGSETARNELQFRALQRPDRIFLASGRGATGCLTELRVGLRARIGIDMDIGEHVRQVWVFADEAANDGSMLVMLALPHSTTILRFEASFADVRAETSETCHFDMASRTLHAVRTASGLIVQISEEHITLVAASQRSRHVLADIIGAPGAIAEQAFCLGDDIAVYVQNSTGMHIHVLGIDQMNVTLRKSWAVPSEVGCLSQFRLGGEQFVFVGSISMDGKGTVPFVYDLDGNLVMTGPSSSSEMEERDEILDTFNSVCVVREKADSVNIVAGTRLGKLLTIEISQTAPRRIYVTSERIGSASVDVFAAPGRPGEEPSAFATCDNMLLRLSNFADRRNIYTRKDTVWATDASDLSLCSPPIHGVCTIAPRTEDLGSRALVLLLSKTSLYVADVEPRAGPVPRTISPGWGGTPTRVIFSKCWNCLVVALQVEKGIDLALVNPDTGHLMSKPLRKDRGEAELQSFNTKGDRILGLYEWVYVKDGRTFPFVVVTTQSGKLLVVSVAKSKAPGRDRYLEHWTRYRKKAHDHAVCAVTADEKGLLYASGRAVYHEILDLEEKRMKTVKTHVLESPVISLEVVDGRLHVLTAMHSVEVVDYTTNEFSREMTHLYSDRSARAATHMIKLEHSGDKGLWPVTLVSDMTGGITGLWAPPSGRNAQELVTVFQGKLRNSVRRFARGLCRPPWQVEAQRRLRFGTLSSTMDGAEVLGVSLDGTLRHFRLLSIDLWRYLALVQALSQRGRAWYGRSNSGMLEPDVDPKNMHIQGDAICHVLENRLLEELVAQADCMLLFCQLLHKLDSNGLPQKYYGNGFQNDRGASDALFEWLDQSIKLTEEERAKYFDVGYEVLGYVLTPAV